MVILRIKRKEFDMIKSGVKKREFRRVSQYNLNLLFVKNEATGKLIPNKEITEIKFINGFKKDSEYLVAKIIDMFMVEFLYDELIEEDCLEAKAGDLAIQINLGEIIC